MRKRLILFLIALFAVMSAHALATPNSARIESTKPAETVQLPTQEIAPVVEPVEAPKQEVPTPTPVDPNGCEAKGMYWRADNYECIAKPTPVAVQSSVVTAPTPPTGSGDCSLVNNYDWPVATAMRVCMQESAGNPNAHNSSDNHGSCIGSYSLMQVGCFWYYYYGYTGADFYDSGVNMSIAYKIWQRSSSFSAWSTCKKIPSCI